MEDVQGRRQTSEDTGLSDDPRTQIVEEYAQVWEEFYRWEPDMCRQVLLSFSREPQQVVDEPESVGLGQVGDQESEAESDLSFTCWKPDGSTSFINFEEIMAKPFAAHPPYEACTPVSRNIYYRDGDVDDTAQCQFIPYADDPAFNAVTYLTFFPDLAWQTADGLQEPDIDAIQLETLRRLHLGPLGMPLEEIDSHDILPRAVPDLTIGLYAGMLWAATHRDPLPWPGASLSTLGSLATGAWKRECAEDDTLARADSVLTHFCPNLNCIEPHCHTHTFPYPPLIPKKATVNSTGMRLSASQTCGGDCFTHITDYEIFKESVIWEDDDIRTLRDILAITPDSKPCDLAVLCRKPCNEVFAQRCAILPDETIYDFPGRDFQLEQQEETDPIVFDDDMGEEEDKM
ncbi:hypothetical protein GLOTRDRAFT_131076 [Gloeophyllum trabeum ATCC 11539]|uniref:Uncharacterized protein n=1 Tax=Gloeophyllum trabeum (strain ATCC 11539 / FP-39264 / Madison 617) TaxID=670483 RepID=S7RM03_GLOTA|nr:uncharacterized protein GLOTRDRAFT_131076 [Gloeophyllum trabeum ATCC 11539]EPQ53739.1 hypothetical protein GLOTRDRAFT_131076 [Gloeophyllum trabeum ATCC 11539]